MSTEPVLTRKATEAILHVADHGPASESNTTAPPVDRTAQGLPALPPTLYHATAKRLLESGHLMRLGSDYLVRPVFALTDLGWQVAEAAGRHRHRFVPEVEEEAGDAQA